MWIGGTRDRAGSPAPLRGSPSATERRSLRSADVDGGTRDRAASAGVGPRGLRRVER